MKTTIRKEVFTEKVAGKVKKVEVTTIETDQPWYYPYYNYPYYQYPYNSYWSSLSGQYQTNTYKSQDDTQSAEGRVDGGMTSSY